MDTDQVVEEVSGGHHSHRLLHLVHHHQLGHLGANQFLYHGQDRVLSWGESEVKQCEIGNTLTYLGMLKLLQTGAASLSELHGW